MKVLSFLGSQIIVMVAMATCIGCLQSWDGVPPIFPWSIVLGQMCILGLWIPLGAGQLRQRFDASAVVLVGFSIVLAITAYLANRGPGVFFLQLGSMIAVVIAIGGSALAAALLKPFVASQLFESMARQKLRVLMFSLKELLFVLTVCAVLLALGASINSFVEFVPVEYQYLSIMCMVSLACVFSVLPIAWLATSNTKPLIAIVLGLIVPLLSSFVVTSFARPFAEFHFASTAIIALVSCVALLNLKAIELLGIQSLVLS